MADYFKKTGQFEATDDAGQAHVVIAQLKMVDMGGGNYAPGTSRLLTSSGVQLTRIAKGVYRNDDTGVTLRSDSPDAP